MDALQVSLWCDNVAHVDYVNSFVFSNHVDID